MQTYMGIGVGAVIIGSIAMVGGLRGKILTEDGPSVQRELLYTAGATGKEVIYHLTQYSDGTSQVRKLTSKTAGRWFNPKLSPDGQTVLATLEKNDVKKIVRFPLDNPSMLTVIPSPDTVVCEDPNWSPDGTHFVYKRTDSHTPYRGEIIEVDLNGENPNVITTAAVFDGMEASVPSYSQNDRGQRIAFQCFAKDDPSATPFEQIFVVNRKSKAAKQLTHGATKHWYPTWSPSDNSLVYTKNDLGMSARLWRLNVGTAKETAVNVPNEQGITDKTELVDPDFSPGGWLAFSARWSASSGTYKLFDLDPSFTSLSAIVATPTVNLFGADYAVSPESASQSVYSWSGAKGGDLTSPTFSAVEGDLFQIAGSKNVSVTALAYEVHGTNQRTGTTAIFDFNGNILAQADVASTDTLVNGYYYKAIPPLTLLAGQKYYIGSLHGTGNTWSYYHGTNTASVPSFITDLGTYFKVTSTIGGGSWQNGGTPRHYVPNFQAHPIP